MKRAYLLLALLLVLPLAALAQGTGDFPYKLDDGLVAAVQTIFGIGLLGIVQLLKQLLKRIPGWADMKQLVRHAIMYVATLIIAAAVTWFVLSQAHMMTTARFILYGLWAWGLCNGWWKALKELIKKYR